MRQQRRQRTTSVAPSPQAAPTRKVSSGLPETGYALIVDGRAKSGRAGGGDTQSGLTEEIAPDAPEIGKRFGEATISEARASCVKKRPKDD
jgi:hypothetical protein